jgi:hypothetical protein
VPLEIPFWTGVDGSVETLSDDATSILALESPLAFGRETEIVFLMGG